MSKLARKEDILEYLFESMVKLRLLRLFLRNPDEKFQTRDIVKILKIKTGQVAKEINKLIKIGFLKMRTLKTPGGASRKVFFINREFPLFNELKSLVLTSSPGFYSRISKGIRGLGSIKLAVLAGIFVGEENSKADILIVGDRIKTRKLKSFIESLEAEVGKEINCVAINTKEFLYRYNMYDRFVREFLDLKYKRLLDNLKI